jgi:hypothetical protein
VELLFCADELTHDDVSGTELLVVLEAEVKECAAGLTALGVDDRDGCPIDELAVNGPRQEVGYEILGIAGVGDRHAAVGRLGDRELPLGEYGLVRL